MIKIIELEILINYFKIEIINYFKLYIINNILKLKE